MKRIVLTTMGMAASVALALAACSSGDSGTSTPSTDSSTPDTSPVTITFRWWGNDDRAARYTEALAVFKEQYPYITVQTSFAPFADYWTARSTEAAGRALPDVMQFDSSYLREYAANGHLLDYTPYIESGTIDLANFDQELVGAGALDGEQVGIAMSTNTLAMFVSPDVAAAAGVEFPAEGYTWEDLNRFIEDVSAADIKTAEGYKTYGSGDYVTTFWFFLQWLVQNDQQPFNDDGALNFDQDDIVEWLTLSADLRDGDLVYPINRGLSLAPLGGFTVNEVVSESSWDNFLAGYSADSGKTNLEMVPIPSGDDGETHNFFRPSMLVASGANTDHPEAAATLVDFLLTDPEVGRIFGTSKGVPADSAQRAAIVTEEGSIDAKVIAYEEAIAETETSQAPVPVKGFGTIEAKWKALGEELSFKNITPEEFAQQWWDEAEMAIS
ncbi:MAG TPA: extracellular solute-binding protein [Cellulomonas sp.]|nr:extracellular solute-binding protein [Cellulomonas sp.]